MVKSNFRLKKPHAGAFLLILAPPLVISGCFISSFKIKKQARLKSGLISGKTLPQPLIVLN
ncbi:hypothetical protein DMC15_13730 [Vibrio sp. 11986-1-5]|nr:hypothetical protein DMC15_13730 [Vibrio sp. 11986-1-5]